MILTVQENKLVFMDGDKVLSSKLMSEPDCDLWILRFISQNQIPYCTFSSSVHWDFISEHKDYGYIIDDSEGSVCELIINESKIQYIDDKYVRYTGKENNAIIMKKKDNRYYLESIGPFEKKA